MIKYTHQEKRRRRSSWRRRTRRRKTRRIRRSYSATVASQGTQTNQ
jgi:hypothetical protein